MTRRHPPGFSAGQKLFLTILIFLTFLVLGFLVMVVTGRMVLPI